MGELDLNFLRTENISYDHESAEVTARNFAPSRVQEIQNFLQSRVDVVSLIVMGRWREKKWFVSWVFCELLVKHD